MKHQFLLFVALTLALFSSSVSGQYQTQSLSFDFRTQQNGIQEVIAIKSKSTLPFIGVSAYIMEIDLDLDLSLRYLYSDGWTDWATMTRYTEGHTPDRTVFTTDFVEDGLLKIECRVGRTVDKPVHIRLFFPDQIKVGELKSEQPMQGDSCSCTQPQFCDRECWCPSGQCAKNYVPVATEVTHVIIHHSAGHSNHSDYASVVAFYWDLHVNTNGWDDIGYNWLIDPNGVIYEGRGDRVRGAHFSCMNTGTVGICVIGNYETAHLSEAATSALVAFLGSEMCDKNLEPASTGFHESSGMELYIISGHLDGNDAPPGIGCPKGTVCPGAHIYELLPEIREKVANLDCLKAEEITEESPYEFIQSLKVFPNPSNGAFYLNIEFKEAAKQYRFDVLDLLVREVYTKQGAVHQEVMQIEFDLGLRPGKYFLRVEVDGEVVVSQLVVAMQD